MGQKKIVCFTHKPESIGGPGTFQLRLRQILSGKGWSAYHPDELKETPSVILITAAYKRLGWLMIQKWQGAKIVHRLDGLNWRNKVTAQPFKVKLRARFVNFLIYVIRKWLADTVVYQSQFVYDWVHREFGTTKSQGVIIYNGTDTQQFSPLSVEKNLETIKIICVEGNLEKDDFILRLLNLLSNLSLGDKKTSISILGNAPQDLKDALKDLSQLQFLGAVPRHEVANILKTHHIFLSLEVNAACPNAIIEALSCGLPVIGFDSGAVKELVGNDGGVVLPFGADAWSGASPQIEGIPDAVALIVDNYDYYARQARQKAENYFSTQIMGANYLKVLNKLME